MEKPAQSSPKCLSVEISQPSLEDDLDVDIQPTEKSKIMK